jgi:hypothetical protein
VNGSSRISINDWAFEDGFCFKDNSFVDRYESGIFICKVLDHITLGDTPCFDINEKCTVPDLYTMLSLELLSGKLLTV